MGRLAYFKAFPDLKETMSELSDAERGRLFMAALEYVETGKRPDLKGNERILFPGIAAQIDRDNAEYDKKCKQNKENGLKANGSERPRTVANGSERRANAPQEKEKEEDKENNTLSDESVKRTRKKRKTLTFGEFGNVQLTQEEYDRLCAEFPNADEAVKFLDEYIEEKKYKSANHNFALRRWVFEALSERARKQPKTETPQENKGSFETDDFFDAAVRRSYGNGE